MPDTTRPAAIDPHFAPEAGRLVRRYVDPDTYHAHQQNWDAAQDSNGVLYVANTDGVLAYDGHGWTSVPTDNRSIARSIAADAQGRIFVGAQQDIGVLRRDSVGQLHYVSLLDHVPEAHRSFSDVWRTGTASDGVYFLSNRQLFRWHPKAKSMQAWAADSAGFQMGGVVRDSFFVGVPGRGLMTVQDDSLQLVSGGSAFANQTVLFVVPHERHGMVVGTYQGLFVRKDETFRPLSAEATSALQPAWVTRATTRPDGTIAVATIDRGLFLFGPDGELRHRFSARDQPVPGVYRDREGGLWALLDGGLLRYDLAAPFTTYGPSLGLDGAVEDVTRHRDTVYVATLENTYRLAPTTDSAAAAIESVVDTQSWSLLPVGRTLLAGAVDGLYARGPDGTSQRLFAAQDVYDLHRSRRDGARIYAATGQGVRAVVRGDTGWQVEAPLPGLNTQARTLAETDDGTLWVGTTIDGVYRVRFPRASDSTVVDHFGTDQGLPPGEIKPMWWKGRLLFGTDEGLLRFRSDSEPRFVPAAPVAAPPGRGGIERLTTDARGRTWGITRRGPGHWTRRDTTWRWAPGPLHRLRHRSVNVLWPEKNGRVLWLGTQEGLIRYVPGAPSPPAPPPVHIRQVATLTPDSLLVLRGRSKPGRTLPAGRSDIRLRYGTPSLARPAAIEYQYRLRGRTPDWSDWTTRTERSLSAVPGGTYTFEVRARTAYGDTTAAARYSFSVLPPWYRTWWAYGLYGLLAMGLVAGGVRWRTRRLRRRQEQLEQRVAERTEEVRRQRNKLAEQAERLQALDDAKSRFFANLSHEFRTPLTLIRGPIQQVREHLERGQLEPVGDAAEGDAEQLSLVERNVARLQRLIDQILGLARLEAGTYELAARPTSLADEVPRLVRPFEPLAERHGLTLTVEAEALDGDADPVYVDREALEHVVGNLLSNAIKFTPEGGRVSVTVTETADHVTVTVADTGPGISEAEQEAIFDRFEQVDDSVTREQEGTGIGLAFAQDLVTLHGGTLTVESTEGEGTAFTVRLPRGRDHLSDDQTGAPQQPDEPTPTDPPDEERPPFPDAAPSTLDSQSTSPAERALASDPGSTSDEQSQNDSTDPSKVVLVVDDNADVRRYVRSVLEPTFTVLEAADGAEGVERAREDLPDVILADVMMPSVDGHEMTRRLKDDPETATIPVIMVTARAETSDEVAGLQAGANDYVTKPFDAPVLRQRVQGVIAFQERLRRRLEAALQEEEEASTDTETEERPEIEREARAVVAQHLTDTDFGVPDLAEEMAMSRSTLYRKLSGAADVTPSTLITQVRIEHARDLLRDGEPVTQVAYAVGYERLSTFSSVFSEHVGEPPSAVGSTAS